MFLLCLTFRGYFFLQVLNDHLRDCRWRQHKSSKYPTALRVIIALKCELLECPWQLCRWMVSQYFTVPPKDVLWSLPSRLGWERGAERQAVQTGPAPLTAVLTTHTLSSGQTQRKKRTRPSLPNTCVPNILKKHCWYQKGLCSSWVNGQ